MRHQHQTEFQLQANRTSVKVIRRMPASKQDSALVCILGRYQKAEGANQTLVVVVYVDKEKRMAILALTR